jgi:hypothetical protein
MAKQGRGRDPEGLGEFIDGRERHVSCSPFHVANVRSIQASPLSQGFLCEAKGVPQASYPNPKTRNDLFFAFAVLFHTPESYDAAQRTLSHNG